MKGFKAKNKQVGKAQLDGKLERHVDELEAGQREPEAGDAAIFQLDTPSPGLHQPRVLPLAPSYAPTGGDSNRTLPPAPEDNAEKSGEFAPLTEKQIVELAQQHATELKKRMKLYSAHGEDGV